MPRNKKLLGERGQERICMPLAGNLHAQQRLEKSGVRRAAQRNMQARVLLTSHSADPSGLVFAMRLGGKHSVGLGDGTLPIIRARYWRPESGVNTPAAFGV